ncbi:MAG: manganese catalase family protein [Clostridia bacterium]|nr:manganese catalase family protein [Clostridia bacterium]
MWTYEKTLQFPVRIKNPNPALAKIIISQLGGPHGELGAATRYLSQRFSMPDRRIVGMLTDVGTEELGHVEIVSSILAQLTKNMSEQQVKESGFDVYFVDHTAGIYPQAASGVPFSTSTIASTGDVFADLNEDLAAEQKARVTYENILRLTDDPDVREPIKFLRQREINHYQRFAECLGIAQDAFAEKKNFYYYNPAFDRGVGLKNG